MVPESSRRRFWIGIAGILALGAVHRFLYVLNQPATDPDFFRPILDGASYAQWARELSRGGAGVEGAFYHAPLFPYLLSLFFRLFGESFGALYLIQHGMSLVTAGVFGGIARRCAGPAAGIAAAFLFTFHHPLIFFASRPLAETVAILLLACAVLGHRTGTPVGAKSGAVAGVLAGLSALARPNFILLPPLWIAESLVRRRFQMGLGLILGAVLVILPVTVRNWNASGHVVPISSNAGITAFHGNGPGAEGIFTSPAGFAGDPRFQREEATRRARHLSGLNLDPVEADRWWGRQALATRLSAPLDSLVLVLRRAALLVDNHEHSLDYAPMLDDDPWRATLRRGERTAPGSFEFSLVPFAALFGLATFAVILNGFRRTGGWPLWAAVLVAAIAPIAFYVSSRYRLPLSALLVVPAGAGVAALLPGAVPASRRRTLAMVVGLACVAASFLVPSADLIRPQLAAGLLNRATSFKDAGQLERAEAEVRKSLAVRDDSSFAYFILGVVKEAQSDEKAAEQAYARALELDPGQAEAAGNLAGLWILSDRAAAAVPVLRRALTDRPQDRSCWANLVVALYASGDPEGSRQAASQALAAGVALDEELLRAIAEPASRGTPVEGAE